MNGLFAFFFGPVPQQHEPKDGVAIDATVDHELVSLFENVQWDDDIGKQNEIGKGEKGYFHFTQHSSDEQLLVLACLIDRAAVPSKEECAEATREPFRDGRHFPHRTYDGILYDLGRLVDAIHDVL